jgi:hypothetical protein
MSPRASITGKGSCNKFGVGIALLWAGWLWHQIQLVLEESDAEDYRDFAAESQPERRRKPRGMVELACSREC